MGLGLMHKYIRLKTILHTFKYKNMSCGKNVTVEGPIEVMNTGTLEVGDNTVIRRWTCFRPWCGYIKIGKNCTVNSFCHFSGNGGIEIGNNVLIATQCMLVSANHNFDDMDKLISEQGETREKIIIEDNCWLGAGVKVLAGVTIHSGSIIGAGTVVTKDVPMNSVVVGVPGKIIKKRTDLHGE